VSDEISRARDHDRARDVQQPGERMVRWRLHVCGYHPAQVGVERGGRSLVRFLNLLAPSRPWTCSLHETSLAAGERCQACLDEHAARSLTANDE
jgi:hypothetical protein